MASDTKKARYDVSSQVKDAVEQGDWAEVTRILSECSRRDSDNIMTQLVSRDQWDAVKQVIRCVGDEERTWDIAGVLMKNNILLSVAEGNWRRIGEMPHDRFLHSTLEWILQQACIRAQQTDIVQYVLPHCEDDQLDSALQQLVTHGLWFAAGRMLQRPVRDEQVRWVIHEACQRAEELDLRAHVFPFCPTSTLDFLLTELVSRDMWQAAGRVLMRGVSNTSHCWTLKEACCRAEGWQVKHFILPFCTQGHCNSVLTYFVTESQWGFVEKLLHYVTNVAFLIEGSGHNFDSTEATMISKGRWISVEKILLLDEKRLWTVDDISIDREMLHHLAEGSWQEVEIMLTQGVSDSLHRWIMHTASSHANATDLITYILPHCADEQLDSVLTTLVERRLWRAVADVLKRNVSDSCKQSAVLKACMLCDYNDKDYNDDTASLDSSCSSSSFSSSSSDVNDEYAVYEHQVYCDLPYPSIHTNNYFIINEILPHCADSQLDSVLQALTDRGLWQAVGEMFKRCITDCKTTEQKTCEHCNSAELYFKNYSVATTDSSMEQITTFNCTDDNLDPLSPGPIRKDVCMAVRNVGGTEVSDAQRRASIQTAFQYADTYCLKQSILPYYVYDSIHSALKMLASRKCWSAIVELLHYCCIDTLSTWALGKDPATKDELFWGAVKNPCDGVKGLTPAMWRSVTWSGLQRSLEQLEWDTPLCEVLRDSLLAIVREIWLSGRGGKVDFQKHRVMEKSFSTVENLHQRVKPVLMECETNMVSGLLPCIKGLNTEYTHCGSAKSLHFELWFIKVLVLQYYKRKAWKQMTEAILVVLTTLPVVPDVQSVALRVMLRHNRWDVIRHACLSGVCEQDRRQLFQAAVKQRQWSAVKRWADHTLYDDQRLWALGEARQEKRWDVYLKLADHGLSEWERVGVLFRVAMHADCKLLRHMLNTVADVSDMIDLLRITPGVLSKLGARHYEQRMNQLSSFEKTVAKDTNTLRTLKAMAKRSKWWVVLHNIRHKPNLQHARRALKAAVSSEAWHAVMQLVRLENDVTRRDSLFRDMVRLRQWAVCRELLEQGVSHQLCLEHISELKEHSQWTLVAMVMECATDDATRKKIMHQAMMVREGSVVWECINKLQTRLSVEEREEMFQLAFNREVWQAVKPLIEEQDGTGIGHRDTALLEAIEQHQWDVVDHCQRHHADINMKDDDGHTPIHRAARKKDWEAVQELTVKDGDPNLLDYNYRSVLQRAIRAKQWDLVKLLIQFHGDIHQASRQGSTPPHTFFDTRPAPQWEYNDTCTPLQMLIDLRQGEVIESSLMWCPDQQKVVNYKEETVLHAVCLAGWPGALHHLIARKVDPLAVTERGHTALCYAVLCKGCPQRMVAECISLGLTTHQPHITDNRGQCGRLSVDTHMLRCPLGLAVMRGLPVVTQMLYESGARSNRQLFYMNAHLDTFTYHASLTEIELHNDFQAVLKHVKSNTVNDRDYSFGKNLMKQSADYLQEMCSTPRSLVSTCRLTISHCLTLSKTRHRDIAQLPLSPRMKNYLMFSDLTDPRYPDLSYRGKE